MVMVSSAPTSDNYDRIKYIYHVTNAENAICIERESEFRLNKAQNKKLDEELSSQNAPGLVYFSANGTLPTQSPYPLHSDCSRTSRRFIIDSSYLTSRVNDYRVFLISVDKCENKPETSVLFYFVDRNDHEVNKWCQANINSKEYAIQGNECGKPLYFENGSWFGLKNHVINMAFSESFSQAFVNRQVTVDSIVHECSLTDSTDEDIPHYNGFDLEPDGVEFPNEDHYLQDKKAAEKDFG